MTLLPSQVLSIANALYDTVRDSPNGVPAGHMYAAVMGLISLNQFEAIMSALVKDGRIRKSGHVYFAANAAK
jgi:hypothetical protein